MDEDHELAAALAMSVGVDREDATLASSLAAACELLEAQPDDARATAIRTLKKLVENLAAAPENPKFRRVRVSNAKIQQAVLSVPGGESFLRALGFEDSSATEEHAAGAFLEITEAAALGVQKGIGALALAELRRCAASSSCPQLVLSRRLDGYGCEVKAVAVLPDGGVVTGGADNLVRLFPAPTFFFKLPSTAGLGADAQPQVFAGHTSKSGVSGVNALLVADDGALLSGGKDGNIITWNAVTGEPEGELKGHGDSSGITATNNQVVSCLADAGEGRFVSGGWDATARIWQRGSTGGGGGSGGGNPPHTVLTGHTAAVLAVAVAEGLIVITGGGDGTLRLWEVSTGSLLHEVGNAHNAPIRGVACCTGNHFASGDNTGRLRRWGFGEDGKVASDGDVTTAHSSYIFTVVGMATEFLTAGDDCVIRRWPAVGPLAPTQEIRCPSPILAMAPISSVGTATGLVAGFEDGTACVWSFDTLRAASDAIIVDFESAGRARAIQLAAETEFKSVQSTGAGAGAEVDGGAGAAGVAARTGGYAINFPVELPGRPAMQVSWNPGEAPEVVAERFLGENGLGLEHSADVVSFVQNATRQMAAAPPPPVPAGTFDFEYPVELSMGGSLTIQWNRGENPDVIADRFLARHSLPANNKPDIIDFIAAVQQQGGGGGISAPARSPDPAGQVGQTRAHMRPDAERTLIVYFCWTCISLHSLTSVAARAFAALCRRRRSGSCSRSGLTAQRHGPHWRPVGGM
jgi:hypothetical protein